MATAKRILEFDTTPAGLIVPFRTVYKSIWKTIRDNLLKENGQICEVCGHIGEQRRHIHCHEIYSYPSERTIRLDRVVLLCWRCHDAVHLERTKHYCGQKYVDEIIAHYRLVNGNLSDEEFEEDVTNCRRQTAKIQKSYGGPLARPALDCGPYKALVDKYLKRKPLRDFLRLDRQLARAKDIAAEEEGGYFALLPDHECPEDTAMWRDSFG